MSSTSIGTARHFHPAGTPGDVCRDHNRAALAIVVAAEARRRGYGPDLSDEQVDECAELTGRRSPSPTSRKAIRAALGPPVTAEDAPETVAAAVFDALPSKPVRVVGRDGREFFLVPLPVTA
ncbi:hypothetical protein [Streptomyces sp. CNQ085]|uniref:hypothetical protein n=1 Tax=Streptomyces sp. CNQ085 TaxID=2886944 RepID=UPI001F514183|nr:hypothetical protein [Streptomyces sp. CNQ085]MCI0385663.1 hypothetical protein [Streptomyces sp. CNQ085]